jgi:hypothetical protein
MKTILILTFIGAAALAQTLPAPYATPSVNNGPKIIPRPEQTKVWHTVTGSYQHQA